MIPEVGNLVRIVESRFSQWYPTISPFGKVIQANLHRSEVLVEIPGFGTYWYEEKNVELAVLEMMADV